MLIACILASEEEVNLTAAHAPHQLAKDAYNHVLKDIKHAIIKSRHDWDKVCISSQQYQTGDDY